MREQTIRKTMLFTEALWQDVADYRFDNRIGSEADCIRLLIEAGLYLHKLRMDDKYQQDEIAAVERLNAQG
jgi:hypothetical protein